MDKFFLCVQTNPGGEPNRWKTLDEAKDHAAKLLGDNLKFASVTICEAKINVERSTPPVVYKDVA